MMTRSKPFPASAKKPEKKLEAKKRATSSEFTGLPAEIRAQVWMYLVEGPQILDTDYARYQKWQHSGFWNKITGQNWLTRGYVLTPASLHSVNSK
jgi:hypothetical protein